MPDSHARQRVKARKELWLKLYVANSPAIGITNEQAQIDFTTYKSWIDNDPDFKSATEAIDQSLLEMAECKLVSAVRDGDSWAIRYFLENRAPDRWTRVRSEPATFKVGEGGSGKIVIEWNECGTTTQNSH